jgi:hypothetical protein
MTEDETPQPPWNNAESLRLAFDSVEAAKDKNSSEAACDRFLYAVGNNHAGTYYPIVLAVIPFANRALQSGKSWQQVTILDALIDLCGPFQPEPGFENHRGGSLATLLRNKTATLIPELKRLSEGLGLVSEKARELLALLR